MPKTRLQIANELEISTTTLWRRLKESNLEIPSGLIYPKDEKRIKNYFNVYRLQFQDLADEEE